MNTIYNIECIEKNLKYLELLSTHYKTVASACTEIINLEAICNLPKGTEHFLTDIHGEYEAFTHVLKNASGVIKRKISDIFGNTLRECEKKSLATLIYYPEQKMHIISKTEPDMNDWYKITLYKLVEICRNVSSKYTRSKVRKALPKDFQYIIEELLHEHQNGLNKQDYYNQIIESIINIDRAREFIIALCKLIQRLAIDRLHILGDIYDRGPGAHIIMDELVNYHSVDIQWGNHDIIWMGAAAGEKACMCNVLRISSRYANLDTIEEGYGINLLPLATFALEHYTDDPCSSFYPKVSQESHYSEKDLKLVAKMHKAISIIQFKIEGQTIKKHPEFKMNSRLLLDKIDFEKNTIIIGDKEYKLNDSDFPTIDPKNPYALASDEKELLDKLSLSFRNSEKLQSHVRFLYSSGSMYLKYNSNLLYHGCIPMDENGEFTKICYKNEFFTGNDLLDLFDRLAREAYFGNSENKETALDVLWYLWCGPNSPLFGKDQMTTFERYFINDKKTHTEIKNPYFTLRNDASICSKILTEFNLDPHDSHIINGHVPVKTTKGESPIKADGKLLVIDGGFSKAYQPQTGIAGYTLIYNSLGLMLASHEPFESINKAISEEKDILSTTIVLEENSKRITVSHSDIGKELHDQIDDLKMLLTAYRKGIIKEK